MKNVIILGVLVLFFAGKVNAQNATLEALKEYTGEYIIKGEAPFSKYKITLVNNDLFGEADEYGANKLLKQKEADTFLSTSSYGSTIIFIRNADKKVIGLKIILQGNELSADKIEDKK